MRNQYYTINGYGLQYDQRQINQQKQDLHFSYETLMHLLSSAENFSGLNEEQYGGYNISTATKYEDLKSEFAWELHCFQKAMKLYIQKYGDYPFPKDLPKGKILNDIQRYINKAKNEKEKKLYIEMKNLINREKLDVDFDKLFDELDKDSNKNFDPNKIKDYIGPLNSILNDIENNAEKEFEIKTKKTKALKKLIKHSQLNSNIYLYGIIGKRGKLFRLKESNCFNFQNNLINETIILNTPLKNGQKLYECKVISNNNPYKEYIYILSGKFNNNGICCYLFDDMPQKIPESYITIIDRANNYGILKQNVQDEKGVLLVNYEDLK